MSLNGHARSMIVTLNTQSLSWLAEVRAFLDGAAEVELSAPPSADRHAWLAATLRQFHYGTLRRPAKSLMRAFWPSVRSTAVTIPPTAAWPPPRWATCTSCEPVRATAASAGTTNLPA